MNLNAGLLFAAGSLILAQSSLLRAAAEPATVRLAHGVLKYTSSVSENKPSVGPSTKVETQGLDTFPAGIEIAAWVKGYAVYAYPLERGSQSLWLGKTISPSLEVGATLAMNSRKIKSGNEEDTTKIGAYVWYTAPLSSDVNFETNFNPFIVSGSDKSVDATGLATKTTTSGFAFYLDAFAIVPLAKNFEYAAGLTYDWSSLDAKVGSAKAKQTDTGLGLVLAKFRYSI